MRSIRIQIQVRNCIPVAVKHTAERREVNGTPCLGDGDIRRQRIPRGAVCRSSLQLRLIGNAVVHADGHFLFKARRFIAVHKGKGDVAVGVGARLKGHAIVPCVEVDRAALVGKSRGKDERVQKQRFVKVHRPAVRIRNDDRADLRRYGKGGGDGIVGGVLHDLDRRLRLHRHVPFRVEESRGDRIPDGARINGNGGRVDRILRAVRIGDGQLHGVERKLPALVYFNVLRRHSCGNGDRRRQGDGDRLRVHPARFPADKERERACGDSFGAVFRKTDRQNAVLHGEAELFERHARSAALHRIDREHKRVLLCRNGEPNAAAERKFICPAWYIDIIRIRINGADAFKIFPAVDRGEFGDLCPVGGDMRVDCRRLRDVAVGAARRHPAEIPAFTAVAVAVFCQEADDILNRTEVDVRQAAVPVVRIQGAALFDDDIFDRALVERRKQRAILPAVNADVAQREVFDHAALADPAEYGKPVPFRCRGIRFGSAPVIHQRIAVSVEHARKGGARNLAARAFRFDLEPFRRLPDRRRPDGDGIGIRGSKINIPAQDIVPAQALIDRFEPRYIRNIRRADDAHKVRRAALQIDAEHLDILVRAERVVADRVSADRCNVAVEVGHRRNGAARRDRIAAACLIVLADHLGDRLDIRFGAALDGVGQLVVEGDALLGVADANGVAARGHVRRLFAVIGDGAVGKINRGALLARRVRGGNGHARKVGRLCALVQIVQRFREPRNFQRGEHGGIGYRIGDRIARGAVYIICARFCIRHDGHRIVAGRRFGYSVTRSCNGLLRRAVDRNGIADGMFNRIPADHIAVKFDDRGGKRVRLLDGIRHRVAPRAVGIGGVGRVCDHIDRVTARLRHCERIARARYGRAVVIDVDGVRRRARNSLPADHIAVKFNDRRGKGRRFGELLLSILRTCREHRKGAAQQRDKHQRQQQKSFCTFHACSFPPFVKRFSVPAL